jgi:hypothetical protein
MDIEFFLKRRVPTFLVVLILGLNAYKSFLFTMCLRANQTSQAVYLTLTEGDSLLVNKCAVETIFIEVSLFTGIRVHVKILD